MRGHRLERFFVVRQLAIGNPRMQRAGFYMCHDAHNDTRLSVKSFWEETGGSRFAAALFFMLLSDAAKFAQ